MKHTLSNSCEWLVLIVSDVCSVQGCQWEVIKKVELHYFCGKLVCGPQVKSPKAKGPKTEASTVPRDRNRSLYSVKNFLLQFTQISEVDILEKKKRFPQFRRRLASLCVSV